jgi:RimJ/RimL family protein N-acetyltransferase
MRVLEKSGFQLEVIIKSGIIKNDVVMDEYLYSIYF